MNLDPPTNRAVLLTPPGGAAIAVVRLAGPGVAAFLASHFSRRATAGRCVHGDLADAAGRVIDDPVVVLHPGGAAADVNLHGGPWVIRATLDLARRAGFDVVESPGLPLPDESVADLAESPDDEIGRETVAHLPLARTELAIRVLLAQREAHCGAGFPACTQESFVQAGKPAPQLEDRGLWWLLHPPRVAIVGAANVGKSTLANQLFAQERSITADLPGTTRDWVGEMADVNGLAVMLVDTPGLRATPDPIEREAIDRAGEQIAGADLVVLVLDASRPLDPDQRPLLAAYPHALRVLNMSDREAAFDSGDVPVIRTVATIGEGVDLLRRAIAQHFGCDAMDLTRPRWWTRRQRDLLERLPPVDQSNCAQPKRSREGKPSGEPGSQ